jgi:hypothetical protein
MHTEIKEYFIRLELGAHGVLFIGGDQISYYIAITALNYLLQLWSTQSKGQSRLLRNQVVSSLV